MTTSSQNLLPYTKSFKNAHAITLHGQTYCIRRRAHASVGARNMRFRSLACEHAMPVNRMYNAVGFVVLLIVLVRVEISTMLTNFKILISVQKVLPLHTFSAKRYSSLVGLCVVDTKAFYMSFLSFPVEKTNGKIKISIIILYFVCLLF